MKRKTMRLGTFLAALLTTAGTFRAEDATPEPKIYGIAYVRLKVTDLRKAKAFYGEELGLASATIHNGNAVQASFAVNRYQNVELATTAPGTTGSYLIEIGLATDDLMGMRTYLTSKGIAADDIFSWPDQTKYFETRDPEGSKLVFIQQSRNQKDTGNAGAGSHKLIHAGFIVRDRAATEHFYKDILGFRPYWHGGMKDDQTDWVSMQVPDGTDWLEFMVNVSADADQRLRGIMNHIALGVPDIHAAEKKLQENGVKLTEEPKIGRDGKWQLNVYDPDLTRIEFMEFTPAQKPCCSEFTGPHPIP